MDDLISRQAAIDAFWEIEVEVRPSAIDAVLKMLNNLPSAERRGKWIYSEEAMFGNPYGSYKCSACDNGMLHKTNFCPNCGARMKGADDE